MKVIVETVHEENRECETLAQYCVLGCLVPKRGWFSGRVNNEVGKISQKRYSHTRQTQVIGCIGVNKVNTFVLAALASS